MTLQISNHRVDVIAALERDGLSRPLEPVRLPHGNVFIRPDNHRNIFIGGALPEPFEKFETVHLRHQEVENDGVEFRIGCRGETAGGACMADGVIAARLKRCFGDLQCIRIVVDD